MEISYKAPFLTYRIGRQNLCNDSHRKIKNVPKRYGQGRKNAFFNIQVNDRESSSISKADSNSLEKAKYIKWYVSASKKKCFQYEQNYVNFLLK